MRNTIFTLVAACLPLAAGAQQHGSIDRDAAIATENIPIQVRRDVEARWRASAEIRSYGAVTIPADTVVSGAVNVQNGPLLIAGRVTGNVTAVNADVTLLPGARV